MVVVFGTGFYGKVDSVNNNWIETKFFSIMFIPIFPLSSMFVTHSEFKSRRGFAIDLNTKSIIAAYALLLFFPLAAWALFIAYVNYSDSYLEVPIGSIIVFTLIGLLFAAAWVYFLFYYGKASADDVEARKKIETITGMAAFAHWFDHVTLHHLLNNFLQQYQQKYPEGDWKADLDSPRLEKEKYKLLFAIALFNCMRHNLPENDELYAKADKLYQPVQENT